MQFVYYEHYNQLLWVKAEPTYLEYNDEKNKNDCEELVTEEKVKLVIKIIKNNKTGGQMFFV